MPSEVRSGSPGQSPRTSERRQPSVAGMLPFPYTYVWLSCYISGKSRRASKSVLWLFFFFPENWSQEMSPEVASLFGSLPSNHLRSNWALAPRRDQGLQEGWGPVGLAHSHGRSPRSTLKWEEHRSGPRGVAQAPASFAGSGLTVRPRQPACRNLLCTFKSCSWFQELYIYICCFFRITVDFSPCQWDEISVSLYRYSFKQQERPPDSQASPQGHPGPFHQLLSVSESWCVFANSFPFVWKTMMKTNVRLSDDFL